MLSLIAIALQGKRSKSDPNFISHETSELGSENLHREYERLHLGSRVTPFVVKPSGVKHRNSLRETSYDSATGLKRPYNFHAEKSTH